MRDAAREVIGFTLIVAGLVAMPIPVIPGIPLIAAGVAMLGSDHSLVRSGRRWLRDRGIMKNEKTTNELPSVQS
jgi:uncharacterized protein YqgC (DUF456 family)